MNPLIYTDPGSVPVIMERSLEAFHIYKRTGIKKRAELLNAISNVLGSISRELTEIAGTETNLDPARLGAELKRTQFQLQSYSEACTSGSALEIRIDLPKDTSGQPDLRKMRVPLGPVVVFGASNFPFAYSTVGGDTAGALAAGCSVIVKAHPAHAQTSQLVAEAIGKAIESCGLPQDLFIHIHADSFDTAHALVLHPVTSAVAFTGSFEGGKALFDLASSRPQPIPVFAEMGSVNPVFIMPGKLRSAQKDLTQVLAASISQGAGQFCTKPGILVALEGEELNNLEQALMKMLNEMPFQKMLHGGIERSFLEKRERALSQQGVKTVQASNEISQENRGETRPLLATVPAKNYLENPVLHQEVFGPFSILVRCTSIIEMRKVAASFEGQLTASVFAEPGELDPELKNILQGKCGRFIYNGVPTGVTVAGAMHHGGPFPATTDSRFTAVGADGIKRFSRPLCFQNWPDDLLPEELQDRNPLELMRTINDMPSRDPIN